MLAGPPQRCGVARIPKDTRMRHFMLASSALLIVASFPAVIAGAGAVASPAVKLTVVTFPAVTASGATNATATPAALLAAAAFPALTARYGWKPFATAERCRSLAARMPSILRRGKARKPAAMSAHWQSSFPVAREYLSPRSP